VSAQRYSSPGAYARMEEGCCPECGGPPEQHYDQGNFWDPWMQRCDLYRAGVVARIEQYNKDKLSSTSS
jgi:hypothetical protein